MSDTSAVVPGFGASHAIRITLLGGLRVQTGQTVLGPRQLGGAKPRHLLIALALARGLPLSKEHLVSLLWEGQRPVTCSATIETYVCVLRKHLHLQGQVRGGPIQTQSGCYALDMDHVDLDIVDIARLVERGLHPSVDPATALPLLRRALASASVPLLSDEPRARWLDQVRAEHERLTSEWLVAAAEKVTAVAPVEAARWARQALDADPLDEEAWYAYLHSMERSGRPAEGLRAYDRCRRLLADELGCAPGERLQQLYARLLRQSATTDTDLEQLIDAVVRLHQATHDCEAAAGSTGARAGGPPLSVEQARRTLSRLLRSASEPRPRLIRTAGA
ncbi:AfsR/SARP family transcriptional regulator [Intrasporangium flavum]|uniref:AfsR/SARP family transcriptional regulator n=1 Tax=Intrasporangium flavum TaxID=1428657 RepID=UPI00096C9497|nr:BTAD domain-containing putative transcriptional regulator [Intrasporangium flavum]